VPAAAGVAATPCRAIPREDASLRRALAFPLQAGFEAGMAIPDWVECQLGLKSHSVGRACAL
jgi:hypothetical protein